MYGWQNATLQQAIELTYDVDPEVAQSITAQKYVNGQWVDARIHRRWRPNNGVCRPVHFLYFAVRSRSNVFEQLNAFGF